VIYCYIKLSKIYLQNLLNPRNLRETKLRSKGFTLRWNPDRLTPLTFFALMQKK